MLGKRLEISVAEVAEENMTVRIKHDGSWVEGLKNYSVGMQAGEGNNLYAQN